MHTGKNSLIYQRVIRSCK